MGETPNFSFEPAPKRGPGRPKGSTNKPKDAPASQTQVNSDVRQALASLDTLYNLAATGLLVTGLENTMSAWINATEGLRKSNEDALRSAPKLAHWIANAGSTGGAATFFITHAMAIASVMSVARMELAMKRAERAPEPQPTQQTPEQATDPTYIPGL